MQADAEQALRVFRAALRLEVRVEGPQGEPALREDVDHVDGHAAGEGEGQGLDGGGAGPAFAVQDQGDGARGAAEAQVPFPIQVEDDRDRGLDEGRGRSAHEGRLAEVAQLRGSD